MKKIFRNLMALAIAAVAFTACEDVPEPYNVFADENSDNNETAIAATGSGTQADPFNVAAVLEYVQTLGSTESAEQVYVKGIVASITEIGGSFGNATYTISDDGTGNNVFTVYRSKNLGNTNFTSADQLAVGDEVVVVGKVVNYNGKTPEFVQNASYLYSRNGNTSGGGGGSNPSTAVGSKEKPKTVAEAVDAINAMADNATSSEFWYVTGKVIKVTTNQSNFEKYGNLNYLISADGTETSATLTIYSGDGLNGEKFSGIDALKAGDEVIVYGQLQKYKNANTGAVTPEMAKGNYLVYYKSGNGTTPNPQPSGEAWGVATSVSDGQYALAAFKEGSTYVVAQALTSDYGYLKVSDAAASDNKLSPIAGNNIFTIKTTSGGYTIQDADNKYLYMTGTYNSFNRSDDMPAEGAVWSITFNSDGTASIVNNTMGKTLQYSAQYSSYGAYTDVTNTLPYLLAKNGNGTLGQNGGNGGNNDNPNPQPGGQGGTLEGNVLTVSAADFGFDADANATVATLAGGTKVTFDKGEGTSVPVYKAGTFAAVRVYAKNTITIEASKNIVSVAFTTTEPSGSTLYNGCDGAVAKGNSAEVGIVKDSDTSAKFSGLNDKKVVITNLPAGSEKTQLRISQMVITFAE